MDEQQRHGTDSAMRQRVGETAAAVTSRARASATGVSAADTGHGVDAHMDRIVSQGSGDPDQARAAVEHHRRELQLAAIARAARAAQNRMPLPRTKRQVVVGGGSGASLLAMLAARPQRRGGAAGQSALAHDHGPRNTHGRRPHAENGRTAAPAATRARNSHRPVGLRTTATPRQKPIVPGGHPGVAVPPPRPRGATDNYPGRAPERAPAGHAR